jgi:peroxiredoxin
MGKLHVGSQAPDFELNDVDGQPHRLSTSLKRSPVILVFFKTSCPTCQFTFPHIQRIFAGTGKDRRAQIWSISQDETDETRDFAAQFGITFETLIDEYPYDISTVYGITSVPTIFVIDQDGKISFIDSGFSKASLNRIAGFEMFTPNDGLPASRPG